MFLDWTTTETNPAQLVIHQFIGPRRLPTDENGMELDSFSLDAPITGTGSLVWHFLGSAKGTIFRTADPGTRSGYIRTRWNVQIGGVGSVTYAFGMYCCASQLQLLGGSGDCYLLAIQRIAASYTVALYKSAVGTGGGLNIPPLVLLASSPEAQWAELETFSTEFRWRSHDSGVVLTYAQGFSPSYADLTPVLAVEDTAGPLALSLQQGFWAENVTSSLLTLFMDTSQGRNSLPDGIT